MMARDGYCHYRPVPPEFRAQEEATEMSQGPYPPGYDPADGPQPPRRQPGDGYPEPSRGAARAPQPDWAAQQRPEGGSTSNYPAPGYAGPESPNDPHNQYRRPSYDGDPGGGQPGGGFGQPGGGYGGGQPGGYGAAPPYPQQPGQYGGDPGQYGAEPGRYGDPTQYHDPTQYGERGPEAGRFGSLRYEEGPGGAPPERKSRRGLIIGVVVAVVAVLVLGAVGFFFLVSSNSGSNFAVNSCVRRSGDKAESVTCSTSGSFKIVSKVGSPSQCPDQQQPYVVLQEKGKSDQVLCLKPAK